ncbi:MAG: PKD domain-containing protein [Bacteroidetes bacterium]|nr:PKD domain-containing protein [Bacteroidota bacterium]
MTKKYLFIILPAVICSHCIFGGKIKACFTVDKSTVNVGDTVTFYNCSEYKRADTRAQWIFGDGDGKYLTGNEQAVHVYKKSGEYEVTLLMGSPEHGSETIKIITVK